MAVISETEMNLLNMMRLGESSIAKAGNESLASEGMIYLKNFDTQMPSILFLRIYSQPHIIPFF